ncbi:membrane protein DedA with SNARE-associated domain [Rhizobium sp. PP-F2F-G48]|uniref:DedA family protein n=1 Tax=Rhizobium sp. PP-F2F-G48 TaxID=2135651 RepID=UPI001053535F|nr:DedA family protein [Rhizobium sp. PP-F2F-G48]TCM52264.1 membrane protein DedA with SNARE-associated domain [Rhizobium sp. PP-F2F-G48]
MEALISAYGIWAVLIGAGVEGEAVAFLGGVLAHRGLLVYWQVAAAAALGSFVADQLFFLIGRHAARFRFVSRLEATPAMRRAKGLLERYPVGFILAFRFIYGMRIISPLLISRTNISALRFLVLNGIAACLWGTAITAIGFLFGNAVQTLFGHLRLHIHLLIALAALVLAIVATTMVVRSQTR